MGGLIKDEDIQLVRERARIDEVVEQYVTLRKAGGDSSKGLCPFHDEKSPSFHVRPSLGYYHCFGCGAGGDAIAFIREIEGLGFAEAVERLAGKYGIQLRYDESGMQRPRDSGRDPRQRARLLESHTLAAAFYGEQLLAAGDAVTGRQFLDERGFDRAAAELFGVGFAPRGGESLVRYLRGKGFADDELVVGGLASRGSRGLYDRFRGRLVWPIREMTGDVVGFGARRLFDDDRVEAKYLNTSETPIYKKSQVLYGLDLARREISSASQAVVVEGYTDVMACHQAGVKTAVATCGTAFGEDHARIVRRILLDHDAFHGEVIFTFDGDEAGQRAAMKAFAGDAQFVAQTYVAVEKGGLDPCDLRQRHGDASVRELIASRIPLYRFVLDNTLKRYDLDRGDQRIDAIRESVTLARSIRDKSKVEAFIREIADRIGADVDQVRAELRRAPAQKRKAATPPARGPADRPVDSGDSVAVVPPLGAAEYTDEREALKAIVQHPDIAAPFAAELDDNDFTHPWTKELWSHIGARPLPTSIDASWAPGISDALPSDELRRVFTQCAVEPLNAPASVTPVLIESLIARLQEVTTARRITAVKSKLQRTNPVDEQAAYNRMFGELVALEQQRRSLRERAIGQNAY